MRYRRSGAPRRAPAGRGRAAGRRLVGGERGAKLHPAGGVLAGGAPARLGGPEGAPGDAVAGHIEAAEGPRQARRGGREAALRRGAHAVK